MSFINKIFFFGKKKAVYDMQKNNSFKLFAFCYLPFAFSSLFFTFCQTPNSGCTDVNATNFDVTASKQIEPNNCTYPKIVLQFVSYWDSTRLNPSTIYALGNGDSVQVINSQLYFSNVQLTSSENKIIPITDSLLIYRSNDSLNVPQNIFLNNLNTVEYALFSLNTVQKYIGFQFNTGLDIKSQQAVAKRNPATSPLTTQGVAMYDTTNAKYYFQRMTLGRHGKNLNDTVTLIGQQSFNLNYSISATTTKGFSLRVPLQIKYATLFKGLIKSDAVDIRADSISRQNKLWNNLKNSITLQ